jgi:hypothetical protein
MTSMHGCVLSLWGGLRYSNLDQELLTSEEKAAILAGTETETAG